MKLRRRTKEVAAAAKKSRKIDKAQPEDPDFAGYRFASFFSL